MKCAYLLQFFYKANVGLCVNAERNEEHYTSASIRRFSNHCSCEH